MAAFIEKFHVSRKEYIHKLSIPMITLMALDSPKVIYGKLKPYSDEEKRIVSEINANMTVQTFTMAEIDKRHGRK